VTETTCSCSGPSLADTDPDISVISTIRRRLVGDLHRDGLWSDRFGWSVVVDGEVLVVGAYKDENAGGNNVGAVYVFVRDAGSGAWSEAQKLLASDGSHDDFFGSSIVADGEVLVRGDSWDNSNPQCKESFLPFCGLWCHQEAVHRTCACGSSPYWIRRAKSRPTPQFSDM
jgi:hypothetical protein